MQRLGSPCRNVNYLDIHYTPNKQVVVIIYYKSKTRKNTVRLTDRQIYRLTKQLLPVQPKEETRQHDRHTDILIDWMDTESERKLMALCVGGAGLTGDPGPGPVQQKEEYRLHQTGTECHLWCPVGDQIWGAGKIDVFSSKSVMYSNCNHKQFISFYWI